MTNDTALVAHLTNLFADPYRADLNDVVVSEDHSVFVIVGDFEPPAKVSDEEWIESLALRSLDFLGEQSLSIIRDRWIAEGYWRDWCGTSDGGDL